MPIYISLLRGINVGGNKKIKMADLRELYGTLGFTDVNTLLQSGNAVFKSDEKSTSKLAKNIESAIESTFGFHCDLFVLTLDDFRSAYTHCPFTTENDLDPKKLLVTFLAETPPDTMMQALHDAHDGPETIKQIGDVLYIYFPDGMGRSKLADKVMGKFIKISSTGRNWNTMTKILILAEGLDG